jgi:hypothetical protein
MSRPDAYPIPDFSGSVGRTGRPDRLEFPLHPFTCYTCLGTQGMWQKPLALSTD